MNTREIACHLGGHHHHDHSHEHDRGGSPPPEYAPPLVEMARGGLTESLHRGAIAVCSPDGKRQKGIGHPAMPTFMRSAAKPLQALPVIFSGAAESCGLSDAELACMCGSLNGEDFQVAAVTSALEKAGLSTDLLNCGVHMPSHKPTAAAMRQAGEKPQPVQNNCAGKHAAMLILCAHLGHPTEGYDQPAHPVQRLILETVAAWCRYPAEQIGVGIDGCGVPVFRVPLVAMAGAYARLAKPERSDLPDDQITAAKRLMAACLAHPEMIAGNGRLCTELMRAAPGKFLAKTGAEGSYAVAIPELGLGLALQVEDGNMRAVGPVVCQTLHILGLLGHHELEGGLMDFALPKLKNHRGEEVAQLRPVFDL